MEFQINRTDFLKGLKLAQGIADRKQTMVILSNVLLRASKTGNVVVAATDLNVSVTATSSAQVAKEGATAVGAKALHDIVAGLSGDTIKLRTLDKDRHRLEISAGKSKYVLAGMAERDFPRLPTPELTWSTVNATTLREMLERTLFATCTDETRFHINGVQLISDGKQATMNATDGHRLAHIVRPFDGGPGTGGAGVVIPRKGAGEMVRLLSSTGECKLAIKPPHAYVAIDGITLSIKLIESAFPPVDAVIPKEHDRRLVVDRLLLIDALKRAQLMATETRGIKLEIEANGAKTMVLTSVDPDVGDAREELDCEASGAAALAIGFNGRYMAEFLGAITSDQVALEFKGALDPAVLRPVAGDDYLGVVMPMRVD